MRIERFVPLAVALFLSVAAAIPLTAAISGVVMTPDGYPLAETTVEAFALESSEQLYARLLSDSPERKAIGSTASGKDGSFKLEVEKEPVVIVRFTRTGYEPVTVLALAGEEIGAWPLRPAGARSGRITAGGAPVAGVLVRFSSGSREYLTRTDEDGRYTAPDPAVWANSVQLFHPEYARLTSMSSGVTRLTTLDYQLQRGVTLRGSVVAENGTAVAGAALTVDGWPAGVSGEDGSFQLERVPPDWKEVIAVDGARVAARMRTASGALSLRLAPAGSLSGTFREGGTNRPLAGALISLTPPEQNIGGRSVIADSAGRFSFPALAPGKYRLSATIPGQQIVPGELSVASKEAIVRSLTSMPLSTVAGIVRDEERKPVAASAIGTASSTSFPPRPIISGSTVWSGPDGRFVLRNFVPDREVALEAAKKGMPAGRSGSLRTTSGERKRDVVITIPRGFAVRGRVVDEQGNGIGGVRVASSEARPDMPMMIMMGGPDAGENLPTSGRDGAFEIFLAQGKFNFNFSGEGWAAVTRSNIDVGPRTEPLEIVMKPAVEITGRVINRGSSGIADVMVTSGTSRAMTDAEGRFVLSNLASGEVTVTILKRDEMIFEMRRFDAPAQNVLVEIEPGSSISGRVIDKETKQPITEFRAGVTAERGGRGMQIMTQPTLNSYRSDDGSFVLHAVRTSPAQLTIEAPGYVRATIRGIETTPDAPVKDLEVALERGTRITGRVTGPDGAALSGVSVRLEAESEAGGMPFGPGPSGVSTDGNGEYVIDAVAAGEQTFSFSRQGFLPERKVQRVSGREQRIDARLGKGQRITGIVVSDSGAPVAGAAIMITGGAGTSTGGGMFSFSPIQTDANGAFTVESLEPGRYTFRASKAGYAPGEARDLDIATSGPIRITLGAGGTVYGRVLGLTERELPGAMVTAGISGMPQRGMVNSDGTFRIEGVSPGSVRVTATLGGMASSRATAPKVVEVSAGSEVYVELEFSGGVEISGRVTRSNQPVAGAIVIFEPKDAMTQTRASAQSDNSGRYRVAGLEPGDYRVMVNEISRAGSFETSYTVRGGSAFDIDIKGISIRGRVSDGDSGEGIIEAQLSLERVGAGGGGGFFGGYDRPSGPGGAFTLELPDEGVWRLRVSKSGYGQEIVELDLTRGGPRDLDVKLYKNDGTIISVIDARDGRTLSPMVRVLDGLGRTAFEGMLRARADGTVRMPLAAGQYRATITVSGYATQIVTITAPSSGMRIGMTPGGALVIESSASAVRRARLLTSNGEAYPLARFAGPDGIVALQPRTNQFAGIAPGAYVLQLLDDAGGVASTQPVTIAEGQTARVNL